MNNKKRNQLIGFIVLLLFALLIAPYVLIDKSQQVDSTIALLPIDHDIDSDNLLVEFGDELATMPESSFNPIEPENSVIDNNVVVIEQNSSSIPPTATGNSGAKDDKNYVIQLVALKNKHKIEELVALLRLNNYDVYTEPKIPQEGKVTRLFVGHYPTKEQADIVIMDLHHLTKLQGIIVIK